MRTIALLTLVLSFSSANAAEETTMKKLYKTLSEVLTNSSSAERFSNKSNRSEIEGQLKTLTTLAHTVSDKKFAGEQTDPTLAILSGYLSEETNAAYLAFKNGKTEYARGIVKALPATCIACHSRNNLGPQFEKLDLEPSDSLLKPIEQAEFYAGTRQFDRAMKSFLSIIDHSETANNDPYAWEHAIKQSLAIAIRVKKDIPLAKKIIDSALAQKKAAYTTRQDLIQWKKSVEKWAKEPKVAVKTEKGLYNEGMRLITEAHQLQKFPVDHSADMLYLRASSVYYDLIQAAPNGKNVSEALMMQGICNEVLSPRGFEDLHRHYYKACIKKTPHSSIAMDCYRRYERSIIHGYTGSAGTAVPEEIKDVLLDLFSLAMPKGSAGDIY
jgi:cytochrome c553